MRSGVLDLAALHEAAYLEHCRQYALVKFPAKEVKADRGLCQKAGKESQ
jgi:hypothetical protein